MSNSTSEVSVFKPTSELSEIFGMPALVGRETREVYDAFLSLIASAMKPPDPIGWLYTKDVTDLLWEIRRERVIKVDIIKHYQKEIVAELIKSLAPPGQFDTALYRTFQAHDDLTLWETDPVARVKIEAALEEKGHSASAILAQAYVRGTTQIDAIDRRIAGFERRRDAALREAGLWNDRLARELDRATAAIIDGEFTETAEGD
jgi:hypothetical protein